MGILQIIPIYRNVNDSFIFNIVKEIRFVIFIFGQVIR